MNEETIATLNLLKDTFSTMQNNLVKQNEENNIPFNTPKEAFIRLNMMQYRQGAIDILKTSIILIDNVASEKYK